MRYFYSPATVRIEAETLEDANDKADNYFGLASYMARQRGENDGLGVSDDIIVGWLGDPKEDDE